MPSSAPVPKPSATTALDLPDLASFEPSATEPASPSRRGSGEALPLLAAREFFGQLGKALKSIQLYQHLPQKFPEYLARPFATLCDALQGREALSVKVEPHDFTLGGASVLPVELREVLAYRFFRDGVRRLTFRAGLSLEELVTFATLVAKQTRGEAEVEGLLETLWAVELPHIEELVVESLDLPNLSAEAVEIEVDQIVGYLASRLGAADSAAHVSAARLRASDLALKLESLEQSRSLEVEQGLVPEALRKQLQAEIAEEEALLAPTVVRALLETVADGVLPTQIQELRAFLTKMLDALILQEDFAAIQRIADRLAALGPPLEEALFGFFREKMGDSERLARVATLLRQGNLRGRREIQRYLTTLTSQAVPGLLRELETIEAPEGREVLRDALAVIGRETPEPFVARLSVANSTLAVDVLHILARQRAPGRVRYLEQALQNPNPSVRLEVVSASRALHPDAARGLLLLALHDSIPKVRAMAAQRLAEIGAKECLADLLPLLTQARFHDLPGEERWGLYLAAASTRDRQVLDLLVARAQRPKGLFAASKHADDRLLAIEALASWPSLLACEALTAIAEDKRSPASLRTAAQRASEKAQKLLES